VLFFNFNRHLRFLLREADNIINTPADPIALQNRAVASDSRMDSMETKQTSTAKRVSTNTARIEEMEDGTLNES
jgi:hypothetical protein